MIDSEQTPIWIPITQAARILDRTINGMTHLISCKFIEARYVQRGKRKVREIKLATVITTKPLLGPRKRASGHCRKSILSKGYRMVYMPDHHKAFHDGYIYEHWLVAEKKLGRKLLKSEQVHHINRIRDDNRPSNIFIYSSRALHMKMSHSKLSQILKSVHTTEDQRFICPHCTKEINLG